MTNQRLELLLTYEWNPQGKSNEETTEDFIILAKRTHNSEYSYENTQYVNSREKVSITCPSHGEFFQLPLPHLKGKGCPYCAGVIHRTTEDFCFIAQLVHGHTYDYNDVNYINAKTKVTINCKVHGAFEQQPRHHLHGHGCKYCSAKSAVKKRKNS